MAVNVIVFPTPVYEELISQVLAIEPSERVNQISLKYVASDLNDTAVTFYMMLTVQTMLPVREPYMCTTSAPLQQSDE